MSKFKIQVPDGRKLTIEAPDQATAVRGAQEYVASHPASAPQQVAAPVAQTAQAADPGLPVPQQVPPPSQAPSSVMQGPESSGAEGNNPMAQGAPALDQGPGNLPDEFNAFASSMFRSPQIVGPTIESGMNNLKGMAQGVPPEQIAADSEAARKKYPVQAGLGAFTGSALPYVVGGMFGPTSTALGLTGGLLSRLLFGTGSQFAINTADNVAHGQDLGKALQNAVVPTAIAAPFSVFGKAGTSASREAAAASLDRAGVPLTAGQRKGSNFLKIAESELGGSSAAAFSEKQGEAFTKAALSSAGVNAKRATPEVIDKAATDLGQRFGDMASQTSIPLDQKLQGDLAVAAADYKQTATNPAPVIDNLVARIAELSRNNGGVLPGSAYKTIRSDIGRYSKSADPGTATALHSLQEALDDGVERNMPAKFSQQWKELRQQYRNFLIVRRAASSAGPDAVSGIISPANLRSATKAIIGESGYARGAGQTNDLARAGVELMTPLTQTNTAARAAIRGGVPTTLALAGGLAGHDIAGVLGTLAGGAVGVGAPALLGKALLSPVGRAVVGSKGTTAPSVLARALTAGQGSQP